MQRLRQRFRWLLGHINLTFKRYLHEDINWNARLIAIVGARGTGKTTLLLQHLVEQEETFGDDMLYVSLDDIYFSTHTLVELAEEFSQQGGRLLVLDEVHKYATWSREIKNIYDFHPDMQIIFTGSSLLEVMSGEADLSRRAVIYTLYGMSFREFLEFEKGIKFPRMSLEEIVSNHYEIEKTINEHIRPLAEYGAYLRYGYFPYYKEDREGYYNRLLQTIDTVLEVDMPVTQHIDYYSVGRIRKLFAILAKQVPVIPNITQLSKEVGVTRISLLNYLTMLWKAQMLLLLNKDAFGLKSLAKPEKIYLGNTNYAYALGGELADVGNLRETFFLNQMRVRHSVLYSSKVDFLVDGKYNFEIGGKNKTARQLVGLPDAYRALDNIEFGSKNVIPLWLFGFTY